MRVTSVAFLRKKGKVTGLEIVYSGPLDPGFGPERGQLPALARQEGPQTGPQFTAPVGLILQSDSANASMVVFTPRG